MMQKHHIDISSALRQSVSQTYSHLVTRPTGAAVREYIEQQLTAQEQLAEVKIDFSHVGMMDFSCADEIVAKLLLQTEARERLLFCGLSESHLEAIHAVLERHRLALAPRDGTHDGETRTYVAVTIH